MHTFSLNFSFLLTLPLRKSFWKCKDLCSKADSWSRGLLIEVAWRPEFWREEGQGGKEMGWDVVFSFSLKRLKNPHLLWISRTRDVFCSQAGGGAEGPGNVVFPCCSSRRHSDGSASGSLAPILVPPAGKWLLPVSWVDGVGGGNFLPSPAPSVLRSPCYSFCLHCTSEGRAPFSSQ